MKQLNSDSTLPLVTTEMGTYYFDFKTGALLVPIYRLQNDPEKMCIELSDCVIELYNYVGALKEQNKQSQEVSTES